MEIHWTLITRNVEDSFGDKHNEWSISARAGKMLNVDGRKELHNYTSTFVPKYYRNGVNDDGKPPYQSVKASLKEFEMHAESWFKSIQEALDAP